LGTRAAARGPAGSERAAGADLERWLREERPKLSRGNDLAKAMDYLLKRMFPEDASARTECRPSLKTASTTRAKSSPMNEPPDTDRRSSRRNSSHPAVLTACSHSDAVRQKIESKGAAPNIPPKTNRRWKNCFSPWLYRHRNAIERLKDFRRITTRYDRLASNFLAAICLAATLCYWL
jgi:transposase